MCQPMNCIMDVSKLILKCVKNLKLLNFNGFIVIMIEKVVKMSLMIFMCLFCQLVEAVAIESFTVCIIC